MAIESPIDVSASWFTGKDHEFVFTVYQADSPDAEDITGWALSFVVKSKKTDVDGAELIVKTTAAGGITLSDPTNGICTIAIDAADTMLVRDGVFWYELARTGVGTRRALAFGTARLQKSLIAS